MIKNNRTAYNIKPSINLAAKTKASAKAMVCAGSCSLPASKEVIINIQKMKITQGNIFILLLATISCLSCSSTKGNKSTVIREYIPAVHATRRKIKEKNLPKGIILSYQA
jgi:predicted metal-binding protein